MATSTHVQSSTIETSQSNTNSSPYVVPLQIGGKEVLTSQTFQVTNPSTGTVLYSASSASVEDAITAVETAHAAFPSWANVRPSAKRDIFLRAAEILEKRGEELAGYMQEETGADGFWSGGFNVPVAAEGLRDIAGRIASIQGTVPVTGSGETDAYVYRVPFGVILGIAPWNAPYILGFRAVTYAIAAGNTAILKAPEFSPRCSWAIGSVFKEAGLPDGVLNVIAHQTSDAAAVTSALIKHPYVKKINFTGSTAVGKIIAKLAGEYLKPVLLELGGKASAIVLADADLTKAANECVTGAFLYAGQICMSTERILVDRKVSAAFTEEIKTVMSQRYPSGTPGQVLINEASVEKNTRLLQDAQDKGAEFVFGGVPAEKGGRLGPSIVKGITKEMSLFYTESFGPSVSYIEFDTEEEAVQIGNDTEYGLSAAVFTRDIARGLRIAKLIESGAVHINGMTVHDEPALPHGGCKSSGYGRFGAPGLDEFLWTKTVTVKS